MKILIISDTHRHNGNMWSVIDKVKPIDMLIHCGDIEGYPDELLKKADCPVHIVAGNNDYGYDYDSEQSFFIGSHKVLLLHGHRYRIYQNLDTLFYLAEERKADIVMFGHLHVPIVETRGNITIINPGSLSYPRQNGRKPSFIILESDEKGELHYTVNYLQPNLY